VSATRTATTFSRAYKVTETIRATPEAVWARLTDAKNFPAWNSTVTSIEGEITLGTKLTIRVPAAPGRAFTPSVVAFDAPRQMVWRDGFAPMFQGTRTFTLRPAGDGATDFEMEEVFRGLMLPMIKGSLPDFAPIFDRYAADLKRACEG
jgi:hypothetical protein